MGKRYSSRPVLTQAHYTAIGRAIVTWAQIEIEVDEQILAMLFHPDASHYRVEKNLESIAKLPKQFNQRLVLLNDLSKLHFNQIEQDEIADLTAHCLATYSERNRLAHGSWSTLRKKRRGKPIPAKLISRVHRKGEISHQRPMTLLQIRRLTHRIADLDCDLNAFFLVHGVASPVPTSMLEHLGLSPRKRLIPYRPTR